MDAENISAKMEAQLAGLRAAQRRGGFPSAEERKQRLQLHRLSRRTKTPGGAPLHGVCRASDRGRVGPLFDL